MEAKSDNNQTRMWDHFQNKENAPELFQGSHPRLSWLAKRIPRGAKTLTIGVGDAFLEMQLINNGVRLSCLDPSRETIANIRTRFGNKINAKMGSCENIPFPDSSFDYIIMSEVLEHLDDVTLETTINQIHAKLRPKGHFLGTVPNDEKLILNMVYCPSCNKEFHRWGHHQSFNIQSLSSLLINHDFKINLITTRAFVKFSGCGFRGFLLSVIRSVLGWYGASFISCNIAFHCTQITRSETQEMTIK